MKSACLRLVDQNNHNRDFQMIQTSPTVFVGLMNRVGAAPVKRSYPMNRWDRVYDEKIRRGYIDVTKYHKKTKRSNYKEIEDEEIRDFFLRIEGYSNTALKENYLESYDNVNQEMLNEAKSILEDFTEEDSMNETNEKLMSLFRVIPRKMHDVSEYLLHDGVSLNEVLLREWDLFRVMEARVSQNNVFVEPEHTILDSLGVEIKAVHDGEELYMIRKLLSKESQGLLRKAFLVQNKKTDERFNEYMKKYGYSDNDIHYYFHGSRNENWYGLIKSGPLLMPKNVVITGKAFGNGIYFANRARKSLGYTSLRGSYWAHGNSKRGYMGIYKVIYNNPKHVKVHGNYSLRNIRPHDAVFAHKGLDLQNDEIIIYREAQATLKYILEIG